MDKKFIWVLCDRTICVAIYEKFIFTYFSIFIKIAMLIIKQDYVSYL